MTDWKDVAAGLQPGSHFEYALYRHVVPGLVLSAFSLAFIKIVDPSLASLLFAHLTAAGAVDLAAILVLLVFLSVLVSSLPTIYTVFVSDRLRRVGMRAHAAARDAAAVMDINLDAPNPDDAQRSLATAYWFFLQSERIGSQTVRHLELRYRLWKDIANVASLFSVSALGVSSLLVLSQLPWMGGIRESLVGLNWSMALFLAASVLIAVVAARQSVHMFEQFVEAGIVAVRVHLRAIDRTDVE